MGVYSDFDCVFFNAPVQLLCFEKKLFAKLNYICGIATLIEPPHDKTNKMACASSEDSDQPGCPPSLIRVFAVRFLGG